MLAHVDQAGDGPVGEIARADQHHVGGDQRRVVPLGGEQLAQREHVDGRLDRGGGHLARVGLPVDHRKRLDLHDVEPAGEAGRHQVRFQVHPLAGDVEAEQRVVEQGRRVVDAGRRGGGQRGAGPRGPAGLAGGVGPLAVVLRAQVGPGRRAGRVHAEPLGDQPQQLGPAVGLDLRLEGVAPGDREAGLPEPGREPDPLRQPRLVGPRAVQHGPAVTAGVAGQRGDRPGVVPARRPAAPDLGQSPRGARHDTPP
ncbi:hypothetical protein ABT344_02255 [Micromonospora carbonacea]